MRHILRSTLILSFFFGLAKLLSFIRQVIIARQYGLSGEMDAFNVANNYPDMLAALISGGALAIAFIPVMAQYLQEGGHPKAWLLFSRVVNLTFLFAAVVSLILAVLAGPLVHWKFGIAPGFNPTQQALVVNLMRLDLIGTLIFSVSGLVMAGLQANQHFWLPAMAPVLYNIGQLFGAFVLAPAIGLKLGPITLPAYNFGVYGLVYGVILGAGLHLLIQIPGLIRYKFHWTPVLSIKDPGVRQVLSLMWPSLMAMFFFQLNFVARDNLASRLGEGAVTVLTYSWTLMQLPQTLIGTALATVLLPTLAGQIARNERDRYTEMLNRALRVLLAFTIPVVVLVMVGLPALVRVVFSFSVSDTDLFVRTARSFLGGVIGYSLVETGVRAFYAQQKARIPLLTSGLRMVIYVVLGIILYQRLGAPGLGLADSLVAIGEGSLLFFLLDRNSPGIIKVGRTLLRVGGASCAAGLLAYWMMNSLPLPDLLLAAVSMGVGGIVVLPFIWPEIKLLIKL